MQHITQQSRRFNIAMAPSQILGRDDAYARFGFPIRHLGVRRNLDYHAKNRGFGISGKPMETAPLITATYLKIDTKVLAAIFLA